LLVKIAKSSIIKGFNVYFFLSVSVSGNNYQKSLFDSKGKPYSVGCQTGGCGPGSLLKHNEFMKSGGTDFKGSYYLRSQPKLEVPKSK
jgi:hypothetical protein